jgi:hypothetical protein
MHQKISKNYQDSKYMPIFSLASAVAELLAIFVIFH